MGVVYRAEDLTLGRTVALKFLPPDSVACEEDRARLVHEARAAAALLHPNICPIYEIAEAEGRTFISMAHIEGRSLKDRVAEGPLPLDGALSIARQIGDGLAAAHAKGIIHRDIKPANVMLTTDGRPMLMDFGLAKVSGTTKLTRTGTTMGTVAYMSPEQVQGREADHRSDIWALGVVLYEMTSGKLPFGADYEAALLYSILNEDPAPLAGEGSDIPAGLDGIIAKALAKDPARRYQKAEELVADLEALARDSEALPAGKAIPAKGLKRVWRRARPWQRAAAVASLIVMGAIAALSIVQMRHGEPEAASFSIAVMDFRDIDAPDSLITSAALTELVSTSLTEADVIRVISSELIHDFRRRLYGSPRGAIDDSQIFDLARQVKATLFLVAKIGRTGPNRIVSWRLVDVRNGQNVGAGDAEGSGLQGIADEIIAKAIPRIASACGVKATIAPKPVESITTNSLRAYQHYISGLLACEEYRGDDAIAELEKAVTEDSTFALAYMELANAYQMFGGISPTTRGKSKEYSDKAWMLRENLGVKDRMRLEAWRETSHTAIIAAYRRLLARWPDYRQVMRDMFTDMFMVWEFGEALAVCETGLRLYPDDPIFGGPMYVSSLVCMGRTEEALRATRLLAERHPEVPNNWDELGRRYLALGKPDSAEAAFQKALELDPKWNRAVLSYCAYQRGDVAEAIHILEEILGQSNIGPRRRWELIVLSPFDMCLASLYVEKGQYRKARDLIREYTVLPDMDMPEFRMLIAMERPQEVCDLYRQWASSDTMNDYPRPLGRALAMLGDVKGAREAAKNLAGQTGKQGGIAQYDALEIEAYAALADHDPKTALKFLDQLQRGGIPFGGYIDIDYRTARARVYAMQRRFDEAAKVHKELLRIYGGHALSHYELGKLYEEMKRPAEAKKEYARFLEMWSEADGDRPQLIDAKKRVAEL